MSDLINSIYGRPDTDTTDGYGHPETAATPEAVDTAAIDGHGAEEAEAAGSAVDDAELVSEEDTEDGPEDHVSVTEDAGEAEPVTAATRPAAATRGSTTVVDDVVAKVVDRVVVKVEGVHGFGGGEGASVGVEAGVATIMVSLVIEYGHAVKAVAEQLRIDVVEAVEQLLGVDVETVDIHITDIHFPDAD
jgi:uncharacterized alkaline shock family protein YloU